MNVAKSQPFRSTPNTPVKTSSSECADRTPDYFRHRVNLATKVFSASKKLCHLPKSMRQAPSSVL